MAKVDTTFGKYLTASVGRDSLYVMGNAYGYNYGDVFDRAQLKYNNGKIAATAGYGKFKEGTLAGNGVPGAGAIDGVKTGYGELEGFFGNGSAVGVYYNSFNGQQGFKPDDLWGAYASVNFGTKFNALANYEKISADATATTKDDPEVWIGKLTYGKASMATPKSWDLWVEYLDAQAGAFLGGSTNSWRFGTDG
jgi:hypothetical protein